MYFYIVADDTSPMLQAKYPSDQKIFFFQYCLDRNELYFYFRYFVTNTICTLRLYFRLL